LFSFNGNFARLHFFDELFESTMKLANEEEEEKTVTPT
jgi:hypothetical protein